MSVRVIATVPVGFGDEELDLWQLTGLQRGDTPAWFQRVVNREYGGSFNPSWYDHPAKDGKTLVVEPYDLSHDDIRDILKFADRHRLNVYLSAITAHFPTRTISVKFRPLEQR